MSSLDYAQMMMELAKATTELDIAQKQAIATMQVMAEEVNEQSKLTIQGHINIIGKTMGKRLVVSDVQIRRDVYVFRVENRDTYKSQLVYLDRMPEVLKRGQGFDAYRLYIPYSLLPPHAPATHSWTLIGKGLIRDKNSVLNCLWNIVKNCTDLDEDTEPNDSNNFRITFK